MIQNAKEKTNGGWQFPPSTKLLGILVINVMKVLLTTPWMKTNKEDQPALGLAYVAAVLIQNGHETKIFDPNVDRISEKTLLQRIKDYDPDIIGLPCVTEFRFQTFKNVDMIKNQFPDTPVVLGGNHVTHVDVETLDLIKNVNFIVRGEGEMTMLELVEELKKQNPKFDHITGLTYRDKDGRAVRNENRPLITNLDDIPFPARDAMPFEKYRGLLESKYHKEVTPIMGSRGCPNQCVFCSGIFGRTCRMRSAKSIVEEMKLLHDKYNFKAFNIWDDIFTINKKRITEICDLIIKEKMDVDFFCSSHVLSLNQEILNLMYKAGCRVIDLGVESGSDRILKVIKKGITIDQAKNAIQMCLENDIDAWPGIMFNHPTETLYDVGLTLRFRKYLFELNKKYKAEVHHKSGGLMSTIYPGTELERLAKEEGILPNDFKWSAPYYNQRNLIWGEYPYVPLFEHIPLEKFVKFYIREAKKINYPYSLITVMYKQLLGLKKGPSIKRTYDVTKNSILCLSGMVTEMDYEDYKYAIDELIVLIKRRGLAIIK
jgi:radical SAM superfamily enzyme YgiQ (UPF0313 family)